MKFQFATELFRVFIQHILPHNEGKGSVGNPYKDSIFLKMGRLALDLKSCESDNLK